MNCFENDKLTTYERAARVISDGRIQFVMGTGEFVVQSDRSSGLSSVVKLKPATFSSMSCSCPGTALCFHIIAAQIASNCSDHSTKRPRNSTTMRKNARKDADKRSGCKKPSFKDVDPPSKVHNIPIDILPDGNAAMDLTVITENSKVSYFVLALAYIELIT